MRKYSSLFWYVALLSLVFLIDRATKLYALSKIFSQFKITNFLEFDLVFNRGMSWGMLDSKSNIIFLSVSIFIFIVTCAMCVYAYFRFKDGKCIFPEIVVVAGSLSNILDRILYGGVIDFIVFYCDCFSRFGRLTFPVFNFADVFIFIGVCFITINIWRENR